MLPRKNADLDVQSAEQKVKETTAMGLPQVSGEVKFQNFIDIPTTVLPANAFNPAAPAGEMVGVQFGTDYNVNGALNVSQLIFNGNYLVGLQASKAYTNVSLKMVEKTEIDIKANVADAYHTVLTIQSNGEMLDSTLDNINELLRQTLILIEEKVMEPSSRLQLDLNILELTDARMQIDNQIEVAKDLLQFQMGMDLALPINLIDDLATLTEGAQTLESTNFTTSGHIDYQLLDAQLKLNNLNLKNQKANYLPSLAGFFAHQQIAQRNDLKLFGDDAQWYPTTLWGLQLNVPIWSSGDRAAKISQAEIEVMKTENQIAQLDQGLKLQMSEAHGSLVNAQQRVENQNKAVEISEQLYDVAAIKFKESIISSMELTQAQSQVIQAKTNLLNAKFELLKAKTALEKLQNKL